MAVKSHVKHRVVDKYFDYKVAEIEKKEQEISNQQALSSKDIVNSVLRALDSGKELEIKQLENYTVKVQELENVEDMVGQTKKKLKVCLLCNSVFANAAHLKRHEANSELHKKNIEAEKIAKELALLS